MQESAHNETSLGLHENGSPGVQAEGQAIVILQKPLSASCIRDSVFHMPIKSICQHLDLLVPPEHQKNHAFSYPITVYDNTEERWEVTMSKIRNSLGSAFNYRLDGLKPLIEKYAVKAGDVVQLVHENNRLTIRFWDEEAAPDAPAEEELVDEKGRSILVQKNLIASAISTSNFSIPSDVARRILAAVGLQAKRGFKSEIKCWDDDGNVWNINSVCTDGYYMKYYLKGPGLRDFLTARNAKVGDMFRLSLNEDDGKLYIGVLQQGEGLESLVDELYANEELGEDFELENGQGGQNEATGAHPPVPPPSYDPYILKSRLDAALQREEWLKRQVRHLKAEVRFGQVAEKRARELSCDVNRLDKELAALKRQRME